MIEPKRFQTRLRGDLQLLQVCHIKPDAHVDALLLKVGHKVIVRELCCGDWDFLWLKPPKFENAATDGKKIFRDGELSSAVAALKEKGVLSGQRIERKDVGPAGLLYRAPGLRRLQRSSFASKSIVTIANDDCTGAKGASSTNGCSSSSSLLCRPTVTSRLRLWC